MPPPDTGVTRGNPFVMSGDDGLAESASWSTSVCSPQTVCGVMLLAVAGASVSTSSVFYGLSQFGIYQGLVGGLIILSCFWFSGMAGLQDGSVSC